VRVLFVCGYEYTVESYWRCLLPARALRMPALMVGDALGQQADLVWIHHPLGERCERLIEQTHAGGGSVVVDFSEDPWTRGELAEGIEVYTPAMLQAAERCAAAADLVVCATPALAALFAGLEVVVVSPAIAKLGEPAPDVHPATLGWWTDGRQKGGMNEAGPYLTRALQSIDGHFWHIQFSHAKALGVEPRRQLYVMGASPDPAGNLAHFERGMARAYLAVETWPQCSYRDTVSDLGILRNAALGTPTLTTRTQAPAGAIAAPLELWPQVIEELHQHPEKREELSRAAREWAAGRLGFDRYQHIIASF
jgi:hypothetical protein